MLSSRFHKQIKEVVLHLDRVVQLPPQLTRIRDADGFDRAHAEVDVLRRKPRERLVGQGVGRVGVDDDLFQDVAALWPGDGENAPLGGNVLHFDPAELVALLCGFLDQIVVVIGLRRARGDDVVLILRLANDGELGADRAGVGQTIGQVDATDAR